MNKPKTAIIILTWNGRDITAECLESIEKITYPNYNVIVVDNGSSDDSDIYLKEKFPWISVIKIEENIGFTGGSNRGLQEALSKDFDYFFLLNNDTIVDPQFLDNLVDEFLKHPDAGLANPKIYFYDEPERLWWAGGSTSFLKGGYHYAFKQIDRGNHDTIRTVTFNTGCALLIKREVLEKVGLFTEKLYGYGEDIDWCIRVYKAGYKGLYIPTSKIWHKEGVDFKKNTDNAFRRYLITRNLTFIFYKHYSWPKFTLFFLYFLLLWGPYKTLICLFSGEFKEIVSIWKGFFGFKSLLKENNR
jgi:GT2 family glycosyltransferase